MAKVERVKCEWREWSLMGFTPECGQDAVQHAVTLGYPIYDGVQQARAEHRSDTYYCDAHRIAPLVQTSERWHYVSTVEDANCELVPGAVFPADVIPLGYYVRDSGQLTYPHWEETGCGCIYRRCPPPAHLEQAYPYVRLVQPGAECAEEEDGRITAHGRARRYVGWTFNHHEIIGKVLPKL